MNGDVNTQTPIARTLERAFEREDLAIQVSAPLPHRPLADIRDPRRAASPRQMQRSRIPPSSPMSDFLDLHGRLWLDTSEDYVFASKLRRAPLSRLAPVAAHHGLTAGPPARTRCVAQGKEKAKPSTPMAAPNNTPKRAAHELNA